MRLSETGWDETWGVLERAVARGLPRKERQLSRLVSVDEKAFAKGHRYETIVCNHERWTVDYVVDERKQESLNAYYRQLAPQELDGIQAVSMDMWDPCGAATKAFAPAAEDMIVFDMFHVVGIVIEAVDQVRRREHKALQAARDDRLKGIEHLWPANEENNPEGRRPEFDSARWTNLKPGRAWAIKESLRRFSNYRYVERAEQYFRCWYYWATHLRPTPIVLAAKALMAHLRNIMTYFHHRISNATAEGLSKIQMVKEMACSLPNCEHYKTAIYFHGGALALYPRDRA